MLNSVRRLNLSVLRQFKFSGQREQVKCDILIVGGGPAGLSTAIRLKQIAQIQGRQNPSVILIEKASQISGHIISGNCFQTTALDELFPQWRTFKENRPPIHTKVSQDHFYILQNERRSIQVPHFCFPTEIRNNNNYLISLGELCQWLAERAQELGVEIFPGTAGANVIYKDGYVRGVATADLGIGKNGEKKSNFTQGIDFIAKQTVFAEGARGSLSESVISNFNLRKGCLLKQVINLFIKECDPQTYGLGLKEVWEVSDDVFSPGLIQHSVGWPLDRNTYGGSFSYHMGKNQVHIGMVIALKYKNPTLNPYEEFQKFKTHPLIKKVLSKGACISYGARAVNEGGYFAIPKLVFPGGMLVGCSAGFLNVMKIKGTHTAMKSGIVAANAIYDSLENCEGKEIHQYPQMLEKSWVISLHTKNLIQVYKELYQARNCMGSFKYNLYSGLLYGGIHSFLTKGREPLNLRLTKRDSETYTPLNQLSKEQIKKYDKHDGVLTFDLLENLQRSGTTHDHDQPTHLRIKDEVKDGPKISLATYGGPEERFCPAKVYEYIDDGEGGKKLQINAQNCLHCKTCDIKMPKDYIRWTVPEGGGGPNYSNM